MKAADETDTKENLPNSKNLMYILVSMQIEKQPQLSHASSYQQY